MAVQVGLLEELRRRLGEVESAHRRDAQGAAERFWARLRTPEPSGPEAGAGECAQPGHPQPSRPKPGPEPSGGESAGGDPSEASGVAAEAGAGLDLVRHDDASVVDAVGHVARLRGLHEVMLVNTVAELERRGVDSPGGLSRVDWLRSLDATLTGGAAKAFVTVARAMCEPRWQELAGLVSSQRLTVAKAARIVEFHDQLQRVADAGELQTAVQHLLQQGPQLSPEALARLVREHTEQVRPPKDEDDERVDAGRRASRGVWFGQPSASGMVSMRGLLDPEAAAVIRSAIDPLSAPCPGKDPAGRSIEPDPRSPAKRRADALVAIVERGVAAAAGVPVTDKAKVVVTIDHDVLAGRVRGAGIAMSGEVLSASMVRRVACEAGIIPMVLGAQGEPLQLGRLERTVTRGMRVALWQRDRRCSFPGCGCPAQWTDAHHVRPWWAGGETSLANLALLCRRHHTYVHRHDLTATISSTGVTWHV